MEVQIEDLELGDEILVPSGSGFMYAILLKLPVKKPTPNWYIAGKTYYKTVKCSVRVVENIRQYTSGTKSYTSKKKEYILSGEDHNATKYINFNEKRFWLIKHKTF